MHRTDSAALAKVQLKCTCAGSMRRAASAAYSRVTKKQNIPARPNFGGEVRTGEELVVDEVP